MKGFCTAQRAICGHMLPRVEEEEEEEEEEEAMKCDSSSWMDGKAQCIIKLILTVKQSGSCWHSVS